MARIQSPQRVGGSVSDVICFTFREPQPPMAVSLRRRACGAQVVLDRRYHNRELEMMKQLQHEYIIKLRNFFEKPCARHRSCARARRAKTSQPYFSCYSFTMSVVCTPQLLQHLTRLTFPAYFGHGLA
eukprot:6204037-Pleurochrysis_carterae.AAC.3